MRECAAIKEKKSATGQILKGLTSWGSRLYSEGSARPLKVPDRITWLQLFTYTSKP
jgi:hypothetical protein